MKIATVHFVFRIKTYFLRGFKKVNSPIIKINDSHYGAKMSAVLPLIVFYLKFQRVLLRETLAERRDNKCVCVLQKKYDDIRTATAAAFYKGFARKQAEND